MAGWSIRMDNPPGVVLKRQMSSIAPAFAKAILRAANFAGSVIAEEVIKKLPGGTGHLANSFLPATFVATSKDVAAGALSDLPYARIQNDGGTIDAKAPLQNLAIPVTTKARAMWPRDWGKSELFFIPKKGGSGGVLIEKASDQLQYVLKPSVQLTGKRYLEAARSRVEKEMPKQIMNDIAAEMKKATKASG